MDKINHKTKSIWSRIPGIKKAGSSIEKLIHSDSRENIQTLKGSEKRLLNDVDELQSKVARLSKDIEEEVERLVESMRERVANSVVMVMEEKATRAQERRDILMKYRASNETQTYNKLKVIIKILYILFRPNLAL